MKRIIGGMVLLIVALVLGGRLIPLDGVSVPGGFCHETLAVCLPR